MIFVTLAAARTAAPFPGTAAAETTLHSLALNGNTAYAEVAHAPDLNLIADWTVELWFKDESPRGYFHPPHVLVTKGDPVVDHQVPYGILIAFDVLAVGERSGDGGRLLTYNLGQHHVSANAWHHVAATLQSSTGTLALYLDGVLVAQRSGPTAARVGNTRPLRIGRDGFNGAFWRGKLDDVRLWNVARTPDQIEAAYRQELSGPREGLVANWQFDEDSGNQARDAAGGHVAGLVGGAIFSTDVPLIGQSDTPTPTATPTQTAILTSTPTPGSTATLTPTATAPPSATPTGTPTATDTPTATVTPTSTPTPTPTPTATAVLTETLPPDPSTIAPLLDLSVATDVFASTQFLYTGANAIQTGVAAGSIDPKRIAVLRGRVQTRDNLPLPGVTVSVHQHPELGRTLTRADGRFDLAVNGGAQLVLDYQRPGFLEVQRQVQAPRQDFFTLYDVTMISLDAQVNPVDLTSTQPIQVARGSRITDTDGSRQATLLFPSGTTATMVFADGSTRPIGNLGVRATEYTVGPNGPSAMPADLPSTSGYTYAVDFVVDEAKAAGATDVRFNAPLPFYVENFLNFPTGTGVPLGSYDPSTSTWVPGANGRVVKLLSIANGLANLDTDGDGVVDNGMSLGIGDAERGQLAALYAPGQSLWRVVIPHFDQPWDINWGIKPPDDAVFADQDPLGDQPLTCPDQSTGDSRIECQNQILGEALDVTGTPYQLHYNSERVPGRRTAYALDIPLSDSQAPASLKQIELEIGVAGQFRTQSFVGGPNQRASFTWDGKNAYGQTVQGQQPITVRVGYTYQAVYGSTDRFGHPQSGAITGSRSRMEVTLWHTWQGLIGTFDARAVGLGGWTLSAHHVYVPRAQVVYRGDGARQDAAIMGPTIGTFAGTGSCGLGGTGGPATAAQVCPEGLAFGPDGSLYIADAATRRIHRVAPNGIITTVAGDGNGCSGTCGDGGPATQAQLGNPIAVAVAPDNSLYISQAQSGLIKIRKVGPDGIISTFAGTGAAGFGGDGGPARLAQFTAIPSLAVGPDGSLYIADESNFRIRRVGADGIVDTVTGTGVPGFSGDGGASIRAELGDVRGIAVGTDGSLYIADTSNHRVRRVTPDGIIRTIAGTGAAGFSGDGEPATQARLAIPHAVAVDADDSVYIVDQGNLRIRWLRPGGTINTLAGTGVTGSAGDDGPARQASLQDLASGLAVGPDRGVYVSQTANNVRVRRIAPLADTTGNGTLVPSQDGREVYQFTTSGQHTRTVDALTGAVRQQFAYDAAGRLIAVTDLNGNVTRIEHDAGGAPTAVVGPFGQRTQLATSADGYLTALTSPGNQSVQLTYTTGGLLTQLTDPRAQVSQYAYDADGRLTSATDPTGAVKRLSRTGTERDHTVTLTTPLGRASTYRLERLDNGDIHLTTTSPSGAQQQAIVGQDGTHTTTFADGTVVSVVLKPDPRWGMLAPLNGAMTVTTPGGKVLSTTLQRTVTLGTPTDPLSLSTLVDTLTMNGRVSTSSFDAATRTLRTTSAGGRVGTVTFDNRGRAVRQQTGDITAIDFTYNALGQLVTVAQGGRVSSFRYGADGLLASGTDPVGRVNGYAHDTDGHVTQRTLPDTNAVGLTYDPNGNVTGIAPPGRPSHGLSYTPRDEIASYTPPLVGAAHDQVRYTYDGDREPLRADLPDGQVLQYGYDAAGRLALLTLPSGALTYTYDGSDRIAGMSTPAAALAYAYDAVVPTSITWTGAINGGVSQSYDTDFRVASEAVNGGTPVSMRYDADSLLIQAGGLTLTRSPQTRLVTGTALGSVADTLIYDSFGDMTQYAVTASGTSVYSLDVSRDAIGRITTRTETIGGTTHVFTYAYDPVGRLVEVRQDGTVVESYTYDANGNRLTAFPGLAATYDAQDRLTQYGTVAFTNTPNGQRQTRNAAGSTTTYQYDSIGNLLGARLPGGSQVDYILDARNRRIGKRLNGALVQGFLYRDELRPIAELDGAGNVVSQFVYADGSVPEYFIRGGTTYRVITDQVGSPRLVVDVSTGVVAQRLDYDTFGNVVLDTNPGFQPFGFAGGLYDRDTRLVHFGAREYDPETGRWTARDPIGFAGHDANLYGYIFDDPVNGTDPRGLEPFKQYGTPAEAMSSALWQTWDAFHKTARWKQFGGYVYYNEKGDYYYYVPLIGPGKPHEVEIPVAGCQIGGDRAEWIFWVDLRDSYLSSSVRFEPWNWNTDGTPRPQDLDPGHIQEWRPLDFRRTRAEVAIRQIKDIFLLP